ncbi:acyl-CoA N-acyltransferase [Coniella lustricola]|uniref:Acyl-CoA N-acyltransferase n=1 Tax=Coniella lustricola TaxID=2025994 RepID=A0A2T3A126_9PEZI|nr:acyl-CoA N-acyltransferase [Coniella lustricola]
MGSISPTNGSIPPLPAPPAPSTTAPSNGNGTTTEKRGPLHHQQPPQPPKKPIAIRKATPQDAAQIAALGAAVFTTTFKDSGCTDEQLRAFLDEAYTVDAIRATLEDPGLITFVAVDRDMPDNDNDKDNNNNNNIVTPPPILAFLLLNTTSSPNEPAIANARSPNTYPSPVEVQRLYVALGNHGRGIGKQLMRYAEAFAVERGYVTCWLGVWERNFVAQRLYAGLGYVRIGEHVFDVGGDAQTDWILAKRL